MDFVELVIDGPIPPTATTLKMSSTTLSSDAAR